MSKPPKSPKPMRAAPVDLVKLVLIAAACLCLLAISPTGKATEFSLPTPGGGPTTIALSPDGTLWFTEQAGNRIGRMAPDGTAIKEFELPNPDSAPRIITIGSDGNFWFTEHLGNRVGRITPDGQITEFPIPTPDSQPRAIAVGPDGNLWFG